MSYDEWINSINILMKSNNNDIKDKLLKEEASNEKLYLLEPKLFDLIKIKFNNSVQRIIDSLAEILSDNYSLDLALIDFKKKVKFVYELIDIKIISDEKKDKLKEMIVSETNKVYDILLDEARYTDPYGILEQTIKNNRIKWS